MTQLQIAHALKDPFSPEEIAKIPTESERLKHQPFADALESFHEKIKQQRQEGEKP